VKNSKLLSDQTTQFYNILSKHLTDADDSDLPNGSSMINLFKTHVKK